LGSRGWFEQALGVLAALPESPSTLEQAFEIRFELRSVLNQLGELRQTLERLHEAEVLAERLNDDRRPPLGSADGRRWSMAVQEASAATTTVTRLLDRLSQHGFHGSLFGLIQRVVIAIGGSRGVADVASLAHEGRAALQVRCGQ
jgi:hypothetical protein